MGWDKKYIDFGKVTTDGVSVFVYSSMNDRVALSNCPCGKIQSAYWSQRRKTSLKFASRSVCPRQG